MLIRTELPADTAAIHAVHVACFDTPLEAHLVAALRANSRLMVSLVAESNGEIVGHVAFSPVTAGSAPAGIGLAPLAVLEAHRRRGIAAQLVRDGLAACQQAGFTWGVVLGEPAYYSRFGFRPAAEFGLSDEYGGGSYFQALEFSRGGLPAGAGLVQYSPEFAACA